MKNPERSIRFSLVVKRCGKPHNVTLWGRPDKTFRTAVQEQRVMTVSLQTNSSKKDFGVVGFRLQKNASYFVFPKSLTKFKEMRIVGIKYELITGAQVSGQLKSIKGSKPSRQLPPPKPSLSRFLVTSRFTAAVEITEEIEAANEAGARSFVTRVSGQKEVDFSKTRPTPTIVKIVKQ